jgi:hypothetical protein
MALVQGIYDLGKPGREQSLYTNRRDDAAMIQENFMATDEFVKCMKTMHETHATAWNCAWISATK